MPNSTNDIRRGILQMISCTISFGLMVIFVKLACQTIPSMQVVFVRSIFGTIAIGFLIWRQKASWIGKNVLILALRGIFGFIALSLHFYAISKLGLGTAVILNYTSPIYVAIMAHVFLGERTGWFFNAMILTSFVGLYLLIGPQFESKPVPLIMGILSGIFAAIAYILIRANDENESPYTIIFYFMAVGAIGSVPFLKLGTHWPSWIEWIGLLGVSVSAFFGQVWLTKSIQSAPVSVIMPFSYLTPVFATLAGIVFWKDVLTPQIAIGTLIIIASGASIYFFKQKTSFIPIEE